MGTCERFGIRDALMTLFWKTSGIHGVGRVVLLVCLFLLFFFFPSHGLFETFFFFVCFFFFFSGVIF